jgi:hypothetical protein
MAASGALLLGLALFVACGACGACGDNAPPVVVPDAEVDAFVPVECWPSSNTSPRGTVTLGTGEDNFALMPDELPVVWGEQAGFHMEVHARIAGLVPGNTKDLLDPSNPRTRFTIKWTDTDKQINNTHCPFRVPYKPSATSGAYDMLVGVIVMYENCYKSTEIFDREVLVKVEVIDAQAGYASDEKRVMARPPVGWDFNNPLPSGSGCPDS